MEITLFLAAPESKNSLKKLLVIGRVARVIINSLRNMLWVKMEYSREQIGTVKKQILVYLPDACCFQIAKGLLFTKKISSRRWQRLRKK